MQTPILGLASDCSAQSDCLGCRRTLNQGSPSGELTEGGKKLASLGEGEWRSKHDTGQLFPPITFYPTHGKKLAQHRDCKISRRCSVSPSRTSTDVCQRGAVRQCIGGGLLSLPGVTARLGIGTPRCWHPLSSGPTSAWRQPSLSADPRSSQRGAQSF